MKVRPTREEIKKMMVKLVNENGPYEIEGLWLATRKAFGQKLEDMYSESWIPEIELRRSISELLFEQESLFFLPNRKLGSKRHMKAANK